MMIDIKNAPKPFCNKDAKQISNLASFLKAISEENRLRIICFLTSGEKCVCEIYSFLDLSQNLVSHHLKVLRDEEILQSRKSGLNVYYSIDWEKLNSQKEVLSCVLKNKIGDK